MEISELWKYLESLSEKLLEDAEGILRDEAKDKALELPVEETFANIRFLRNLYMSLINENRFSILPHTIQKSIGEQVSHIMEFLRAGVEGQEAIESLTKEVENSVTFTWQYNLVSIPDDYLIYSRKIEYLKRLEESFAATKRAMDSAFLSTSLISDTLSQAEADRKTIANLLINTQESVEKVIEGVSSVSNASADADNTLKKIKEVNTETTDFRAKAELASSEAKSLSESIRDFFNEISTYRVEMSSATSDSSKAISETKEEVLKFLDRSKKDTEGIISSFNQRTDESEKMRQEALEKLDKRMAEKESRIDEQLLKATGKSLFTSFDKRRETLARSKWIWAGIVLTITAMTAGWAYHLSTTVTQMSLAVGLRISATLPMVGALWFALSQYAKERHFEEAYAFRSNISVSLVPYRDEVLKLFRSDDPEGQKEFTAFVLRAIDRVYAPIENLPQENSTKEVSLRVADLVGSLPKGVGDLIEKITALIKVAK